MVITASSMYVALRISALPWPTVFIAVLSLAILKVLGRTNIHEINIAKTGMSAGAMIAGGVAFTLPGLWIAGIYEPYSAATGSLRDWILPKLPGILGVTLAGTLLGTVLCWSIRKFYLRRLNLAYPIGTAAAEILKAADEGGTSSRTMFVSLGLSSLFTLLRDGIAAVGLPKILPERLVANISGYAIGLEFSPMGLSIGYLIGFLPASLWFTGAILANWLINTFLVQMQVFASPEAASAFNFTAAIGLMVGGGIGIIISFIFTLKNWRKAAKTEEEDGLNYGEWYSHLSVKTILIFLAVASSIAAGLSLPLTIAICLGVVFATAMSATITGQTGVNPMEIFGIIVLLTLSIFFDISGYQAFLVTALVAVACGYAGDLMNDYQAGKIIRTDPNSQLISELVGGIVGAFVAVVALFAVIYQYGGVGGETGLSAVQAHTVSSLLNGVGDLKVFSVAALIGCVLFLFKIPSMIIGIGMLLGIPMATAVFIGGVINCLIEKKHRQHASENGQLIAAGMLGGEGITGTLVAIITMLHG